MATNLDTEAVRELTLYADNTAELHRRECDIIRNLAKRIAKGTYDATLAPKLWRYWYDEAAKRYVREFGTPGERGYGFMTPAVRQAAADDKAVYEYERITSGEWSIMLGIPA